MYISFREIHKCSAYGRIDISGYIEETSNDHIEKIEEISLKIPLNSNFITLALNYLADIKYES